jgi:hypothetical protein
MFNKIKELFKKKPIVVKDEKLEQAQKYYEILQSGAMFVQYILQDLKKSEANLDRKTRRKMERDLVKDGRFNEEVIRYYATKIENVLYVIEEEKKKKNGLASSCTKQHIKCNGEE